MGNQGITISSDYEVDNTHDGTQTSGEGNSATHVTGNQGITISPDYEVDNTHDGTQTSGEGNFATHVTGNQGNLGDDGVNSDNDIDGDYATHVVGNQGITVPSDHEVDIDSIMSDGGDGDDANEFNGASRTTGGIFRGKAVGNALDMADFNMELESVPALTDTGKVLLFTSHEKDAEPMSMKFRANEPLSSVLSGLGKLYSPIKHRNSHIYVRDDNAWAMKGRFSNAIRSQEALPWIQDNRGSLSVSLLAVSIFTH
jgi:hypothetical protein